MTGNPRDPEREPRSMIWTGLLLAFLGGLVALWLAESALGLVAFFLIFMGAGLLAIGLFDD